MRISMVQQQYHHDTAWEEKKLRLVLEIRKHRNLNSVEGLNVKHCAIAIGAQKHRVFQNLVRR